MLTEPQFKVLMILFDDKGHAGWELARDVGKRDSYLNLYLGKLMTRKFIIKGDVRKSTKQKRRQGNYGEDPFYLNKDLDILRFIITEMVITNRKYNLGFQFWDIKKSQYIKSMKKIYKEDLDKCLADLSNELYLAKASEIEPNIKELIKIQLDKEPDDSLE
jgi:hypothetical protein